jgi:hypothetical protein
MPSHVQTDSTGKKEFPVSLVLEFQRTDTSAWSGGQWQVVAALAGWHGGSRRHDAVPLHKDEAVERVLCSGYRLRLYRDDAESYYCNLMGEHPGLFVVCGEQCGERPQPTLVTASYGEAASYSETDGNVYAVAIPPEIYRWIEAYVLEHYVPEKRRKRKRDNWKDEAKNRSAG